MRSSVVRHFLAAATVTLVVSACGGDGAEPTVAPPPGDAEPSEGDDEAEAELPEADRPAPPPSTEDVPAPEEPVTADEGSDDASAAQTVSIVEDGDAFAFDPVEVEIAVGDAVTWVHEGAVDHTVSGAGINSGPMSAGESFTMTFDEAGTFDYLCYFHPEMVGTVLVS